MRLLQLATGSDELIDLHPNVTVVTGLTDEGRRRLTATVLGLATGEATGPTGLLEAHGVLFDLTPDMLSLLEIATDGVRPVVTLADLPTARHDPQARERNVAERAVAEAEERWVSANEENTRVRSAMAASREAVERARRARTEAEADAAGRIDSIDEITARLDQAIEQRRRLEEERTELSSRAEGAAAARAEVEDTTAEVRQRRQAAGARCSELAARLDESRMGCDPAAEADAERAADRLAEVEAEVEAEREAERSARDDAPEPEDAEAPRERLERLDREIDELDKRLAAFGPAEVHEVANALEHLRSQDDGELVPMPEASALADELTALEAELRGSTVLVGTGGLAEGRTRLDDARQSLLEAEQDVRNPELDRVMVDRLEQAHADLLDAIDKADGRFGGARAERKVDLLRSAEHAILDQMDFTSYSDYMMGYSLLHVDPEKEATLDAARVELSLAEDAWHALEAETDAELARAELMERRRVRVDAARALLGRPVPAGSIVEELRAARVEARTPPAVIDALRRALDEAGLALGDDLLDAEDLVLVAEAWLAEAAGAATREQDLRGTLVTLGYERVDARAAVEAEAAREAEAGGPPPEEQRAARVAAAQEAAQAAEERRRAHATAEEAIAALTDELAQAAEVERVQADAARDAIDAVEAAANEEEAVQAELRRVEAALAETSRVEADGQVQLRVHDQSEDTPTPEELAATVAEAEATAATDAARAEEVERRVAELEGQRLAAIAAVEELRRSDGPIDESSLAEEIEWYLLARLAAQRAVSLAGSVPLLLDDALEGLDTDALEHVLGRLERMAEAVQVIVVSDDPLASAWALLAGADRAAVVRPQPA